MKLVIFSVFICLAQGCKSISNTQHSEVEAAGTQNGLSFKTEYVMYDRLTNPTVMYVASALSDSLGVLTDEYAVAIGKLQPVQGNATTKNTPHATWTACIAKPGPLAFGGGFVTTGISLFMSDKPDCALKFIYTGDVGEGGQKANYVDKGGVHHDLFALDRATSQSLQDTTGVIEKVIRAAVHAYRPTDFRTGDMKSIA